MPTDFNQTLALALGSVIKSMAALPAEIVDHGEIPAINAPLLHAHIGFTGEHAGEIGLLLDPALAALLAQRILGVESPDLLLEDMIEDAVNEVLNIVCGQFLSMAFGETPVFSLTVPHAFPLGVLASRAILQNPQVTAFMVDGHTLLGYARVKPAR